MVGWPAFEWCGSNEGRIGSMKLINYFRRNICREPSKGSILSGWTETKVLFWGYLPDWNPCYRWVELYSSLSIHELSSSDGCPLPFDDFVWWSLWILGIQDGNLYPTRFLKNPSGKSRCFGILKIHGSTSGRFSPQEMAVEMGWFGTA